MTTMPKLTADNIHEISCDVTHNMRENDHNRELSYKTWVILGLVEGYNAANALKAQLDKWMAPHITLAWTSNDGFEQDECQIRDISYSEHGFMVESSDVQKLQNDYDQLRKRCNRMETALKDLEGKIDVLSSPGLLTIVRQTLEE